MEFWRALDVGQVKLKEMQGAVLQRMRMLGQKGRTSGLRMARGKRAERVLERRPERNHRLNGDKIVFHALFGGAHHSDQENDIFLSPFFKYFQFCMSTGLGREVTTYLSINSKTEDALSG